MRTMKEWGWLGLAAAMLLVLALNPAIAAPAVSTVPATRAQSTPAFFFVEPVAAIAVPPVPRASPRAAASARALETTSRLGLTGVVIVMLAMTLFCLALSAPQPTRHRRL
ncbi:MAG: hypothetical protein GC199_03990 [Alphaproteobacteria bacterium]|nr:hypothetical protein [Alphaproteobacteria bacterium]